MSLASGMRLRIRPSADRVLAVCLVLASWSIVSHLSAAEPAGAPKAEVEFKEGIFCGVCHTNSDDSQAMRDAKGRPIAPYDLWRASPMANSARDPYWRAVVSVEAAATPSKKAEIEQACSGCHAPMAAAVPESPAGVVLEYLRSNDERAFLANDGVSCTVCHQITDEKLGTEDSFNGRFTLGDQRLAFGPHADPLGAPMKAHAGYQPVESQHVMRSALCATCHTLITDTLDPDGSETGDQFHEQAAYLEWRNSVYNDEQASGGETAKSCQACHLPVVDEDGQVIRTVISRAPGGGDFDQLQPRSPYGRHLFVGGNTLLAQMLRDNSQELAVFASDAAFDATIAATRNLLQTSTAEITIGDVQWQGGKAKIPVRIGNLAGHKLPTGFPSRRLWVRLEVRDHANDLLFQSGAFNADGQIIDAAGQPLASEQSGGPTQPHYSAITAADQVQIYESVMADKNGQPTFLVMRGAGYHKDNRLLPVGWSAQHPDAPATSPAGVADDQDFRGGEDTIWYEVPLPANSSVSIQASLHFQSIGVRHVHEVLEFQTPEVQLFRRMYQAADRRPETLAETSKRFEAR